MPRRLDAFVLPGKFLVGKIAELKKQQQEQSRRKVTERELAHLHHKIDKLLIRLEENEPEPAMSPDEECAICISAKATMQTFPCGHRVVCRKCFVKTIQMAVSQRLLPLRCVICRAKILRLKQHASGGGSHHHQLNESHPHPGSHYSSSTMTTTEDMPRLLSSSFQDRINNSPGVAKMTQLANPEVQKLRRRNGKKSNFPPPTTSLNSSSHRRRLYGFGESRSPAFLLPIPELEELKIVRAVQQPELCRSELCKQVWSPKDDLIKKAVINPNPKAKKKQEDVHHHELTKWWSRLRSFRPPAILKVIKKKLKQY